MKLCALLQGLMMLGLVGLLPSAAAAAQQAKNIGRIVAMDGKVTVLHQGKFAAELLTIQAPVFQEDIIVTGQAAKVRILLTDGSVVALGEQSRLELQQFSQSGQQQTRSGRFAIPMGIFRLIIKELLPPVNFEVETPTAVAAIRGTDLMGEVSPESTAIVVLEGTVVVSSTRTRFRGLTTLTPGTGTTVKDAQPPSSPTRWSESRIESLRNALTIP